MKKVIIEFTVISFVFIAILYLLNQVNWMSILRIEKVTQSLEEKTGDLFWEVFEKSGGEIKDEKIVLPIDSMITHICISNNINRKKIKLHIVQNKEINAFTLPNNHIVVYSGLINACSNEAELCGVLCHEMAHMEKRHVMNKLIKDYGLTVIVSITSGQNNASMIKELVKNLSSTAYDRKLEREADLTATDYLIAANIDPEAFANFLYKLSTKDKMPNQLYWISTHPESKERSKKIIEKIKNKKLNKINIVSSSTWKTLSEITKSYESD